MLQLVLGLESLSEFEKVRQVFEQLPQYSIKTNNEAGEILIRKGPESDRTHFIHVMESKGQRMKDSLKFRDVLRSNSQIRNEYCKLKYLLASKYPDDRESYTVHKTGFIEQVLKTSTRC